MLNVTYALTIDSIFVSDTAHHHNKWLLQSEYFKKYATTSATGSTIKNVSLKSMKSLLVPLPPIEEQFRIVKKIEELFSKVDSYSVYYSELNSLNKKFPGDLEKSILQYAIVCSSPRKSF
ncbi:restriction endonuclease subunit S [Mycobacteroides abscessus subsp. abscessus]|nr:restriction endonuclease subunit S [Mycobacteroides abscessus subsp. abscessus]